MEKGMIFIGDNVGHLPKDTDPDVLMPHLTALEAAQMYGHDTPSYVAYGKVTKVTDTEVTIWVDGGALSKRQSYTFPLERAQHMKIYSA